MPTLMRCCFNVSLKHALIGAGVGASGAATISHDTFDSIDLNFWKLALLLIFE